MKLRTAVIFVLVWIGLLTCGCPRSPRRQVILPPEVAGTWKARESTWRIVISPDGTVASAVIDMGAVEVSPNKTTKVEMRDGQFSTYKAADCVVEYTPATRDLYVSVEMEDIHVVFLDNVIDGNSVDRFVGPVSQDGKEWTVEWVKIFDYGPRFPAPAPDERYSTPLVFDKVED